MDADGRASDEVESEGVISCDGASDANSDVLANAKACAEWICDGGDDLMVFVVSRELVEGFREREIELSAVRGAQREIAEEERGGVAGFRRSIESKRDRARLSGLKEECAQESHFDPLISSTDWDIGKALHSLSEFEFSCFEVDG